MSVIIVVFVSVITQLCLQRKHMHRNTCNGNPLVCQSLSCCIFHQSSCLAAARACSPFLVGLDGWTHVGPSQVK